MKRRGVVLGVLFVSVVAIGIAWQHSRPIDSAPLALLDGSKPRLADWRGGPVLLTFWSPDCPTCLREIPTLIDWQNRYATRGLHMVAIAAPYDMPSRVVSFAREAALPYAVALDLDGAQARAFTITATPTTVLLDRDGHLVERQLGDFDAATWSKRIDGLLMSPAL